MHNLRSSSHSVLLALALAACPAPKDPVDTATDTDTGSGSSTGAAPTSESASSTMDAPTTSTTTASTGPDTASTGSIDASTGSTTSEPPDGLCVDRNHGEYWCECSESQTKACGDNGVSVCMLKSDTVITHHRWGPCGECVPPGFDMISQGWQECDAEGEPGRQFCNVFDYWVGDIENLPTPLWGTCLTEADIVCEPGESEKCPDDVFFHTCDVDEKGIPFWTPCG